MAQNLDLELTKSHFLGGHLRLLRQKVAPDLEIEHLDAIFAEMVLHELREAAVEEIEQLPERKQLSLYRSCMAMMSSDADWYAFFTQLSKNIQPRYAEIRAEADRVRENNEAIVQERRRRNQEDAARFEIPVVMPPGGLVEWMSEQDRHVWHEVAIGYNWDYDPARDLGWILEQRSCDKATAMTIFLLAGPDDFDQYSDREEVPDYRRNLFDLISVAAERLAGHAFLTADFIPEGDIRQRRSYQVEQRMAGVEIHWELPDHCFEGYGRQDHASRYAYDDHIIRQRHS